MFNFFIYKLYDNLKKRFFKFFLFNTFLAIINIILFEILYLKFNINYFISFFTTAITAAICSYILNENIIFKKKINGIWFYSDY